MIEKQAELERVDRDEVLKSAADILTLIGNRVVLKAVGKTTTRGKEEAGPCPNCGGTDRFHVLPDRQQWFCRSCTGEPETEGFKNVIDYAMIILGMDFRTACKWVTGAPDVPTMASVEPRALPQPKFYEHRPPSQVWQDRGRAFVEYAENQLWQNDKALAYLRGRALTDETIRAARLGWNPKTIYDKPAQWGVTDTDKIWLPKGLVMPWFIGGELWRIEIRLPDGSKVGPTGYKQGLYNADHLSPDKPAVLVEGVIDCLTIAQHAGDLVTPIATGATGHARRPRWIARLALCPLVLVAFDNEPDKGDKAARFWLNALPSGKRWRPFWEDVNQMAQDGANIRGWIEAGLALNRAQVTPAVSQPIALLSTSVKKEPSGTVDNIQVSSEAAEPSHSQGYIELWANTMVLEATSLGGVVVRE